VDLSRREQSLLQALLHNRGRVLSTEQLKDSVYGFNDELESNALNVHIHHLRRKLGNGIVETVRGLGYRLGRPMVENNRSDEPASAPEPDPRRRVCADLGPGGGLDAQRPAQSDDVFPRPALVASARMVAGLLEQLPALPSKGEGTHFSAEQLNIPGGMACQVSSLRGEILARSHSSPEQTLEAENGLP
jgi:biotin operon repressor